MILQEESVRGRWAKLHGKGKKRPKRNEKEAKPTRKAEKQIRGVCLEKRGGGQFTWGN